MVLSAQPKSDVLRRLYWRDELLQLLFWIEGEGFGSRLDAEVVDRFLGADGEIAVQHLDRLAAEGYLEGDVLDGYRLSAAGRDEGRRLFADEFADLTRPAHGACGVDCWCRQAPAEAAACQLARVRGLS